MAEGTDRPTKIGRYEVVTRLAMGGMAELFLARERGIAGLERLVVLKRILPHLAHQPTFIDMFLREARIAARLAHPNVVHIFDLGEEDGSYFIAMEYIHGSTVRELQILDDKAGKSFPYGVSVGIIAQALRGLHAAHELKDLDGKPLGLVHRDISPHNLMVTTDGDVKLLDFGVAKATEEGLEATYSGNLKGKFAYMSPEQCRRTPLDRRSDIFAMGITLWEMLTDRRLFKRDSEMDMMQAVVTGDIPEPSRFNPAVPPAIEAVCLRALAMERDDRYATAEEMRQALLEAARNSSLATSNDLIAGFVKDVAGPQLDLRGRTLQHALERSLTQHEKLGLLHVTGSGTDDDEPDTAIDLALAKKLTESAISSSRGSREVPPAAITGETVMSQHKRLPDHEVVSQTPRRGPKLAVAAVVLIAAVVGAAVAAKRLQEAQPAEDEAPVLLGEPLPIAWPPTVDPKLLRDEVEPLRHYLERRVGRPMPIQITKSYAESSELLRQGKVAFAVLPPLMYVRTRKLDPAVAPVAIKVFDGATKSDGLLLVPMDSEVRKLKDLEGKKFCFPDRNSTTGTFLPRAFIRDAGHDPRTFIGEVLWSGDHIQGLRDLLAGKCDAAATYSGAVLAADGMGIPVAQLRTLAITGNIPQDPFCVGGHVPDSAREKVRQALMEFDPQAEFGKAILGETQRITGFSPVADEDFDQLRDAIRVDEESRDGADKADSGE